MKIEIIKGLNNYTIIKKIEKLDKNQLIKKRPICHLVDGRNFVPDLRIEVRYT